MVVCKFFLRGDCKFGERCRNEHLRGGSGGNYDGYGGGGGDYYGDRGGSSQGGYGSSRGGSYGNSQQQSNYNPYVYRRDTAGGGGGSYDNRSQNYDGWGGGGGGTKKVTFKDSFGTQNRFSGLSDQAAVSFGQSDRNDDIKEHDILDTFKHDAEEWEGGKIWPLSSYKPNKSRGCVPGFEDISPDEVRFAAYSAEKENKFDQFKASFASVLDIYKRQRDLLTNPTQDIKAQLISSFRGGQISDSIFGNRATPLQILYSCSTESGRSPVFGSSGFGSTSTGFGSMSASSSSPGFGSSAFGNAPSGNFGGSFGIQPSPGQTGGNAGTGLFGKPAAAGATGTGLFGKPAVGGTDTGLFGKPALDTTTDIGGRSGTFGSSGQTGLFGKPATFGNTQSSSFGMTQRDFGSSRGGFGGSDLSSDPTPSTYTPLSELTPEEKEEFEAASFTLGKVPTKPPAIELCR